MLQNKYKGIKRIQNRWRTQPVSCCSNAPELLCDAQMLEPTGGHRHHKVTAVLLRRTVCGPNLIGGRSGQWLLITAAIPGQTDRPRRQTGRAKQTEYLSRLTRLSCLSRHGLGRPQRTATMMKCSCGVPPTASDRVLLRKLITVNVAHKWAVYIVSLRYTCIHRPTQAFANAKGPAQHFLM